MYSILRASIKGFLSLMFGYRIIGQENIPIQGGVIIAPNHISNLDPPVIGCALPDDRKIRFMAKQELFDVPVFKDIITWLGAFPVKRGAADRNAIRKAILLLEEGWPVGIFPEGTRSKTGELGAPQPGLPMIAMRAGVPIVPTAVIGTNKLFKTGRPQIKVIFGKPIMPVEGRSDKENAEYITQTVMQEIARMIQQEGG